MMCVRPAKTGTKCLTVTVTLMTSLARSPTASQLCMFLTPSVTICVGILTP